MTRLWAREALLATGWAKDVSVEIGPDGRIASLNSESVAQGQIVDCLVPAPANSHSHAFQRAMAGLTERRGQSATDSFWTWREQMYRFAGKINPEQLYAIAAQLYGEMLEAGYSQVCEFHYLHHQYF